jgi:hypothetical protein
METYWCTKKNSFISWINKGEDFDPAPIPCIKFECDRWDKIGASIFEKEENNMTSVKC